MTGRSIDRWWLSFADEGKFRGVVILDAPNFTAAVMRSHELGINPGGEIKGTRLPLDAAARLNGSDCNRILDLEDVEKVNGRLRSAYAKTFN